MSYLLDTCIISKMRIINRKPDKMLENWIQHHDESSYFVCSLTLGEIQSGISKLNLKNDEERKKRLILEDWFLEDLIPRFNNRILTINEEVSMTWGRMSGEGKQRGIVIPTIDGLIAATAIVHNLTLVTENIKDFMETGARVFNPWLS